MGKKAKSLHKDYYHVTDGEWIAITRTSHRHMCCDCYLVHVVDHKITKEGEILVRWRRSPRHTAAARRGHKIRLPDDAG